MGQRHEMRKLRVQRTTLVTLLLLSFISLYLWFSRCSYSSFSSSYPCRAQKWNQHRNCDTYYDLDDYVFPDKYIPLAELKTSLRNRFQSLVGSDKVFSFVSCDAPNSSYSLKLHERYEPLELIQKSPNAKKYLIALNLHNNEGILPSLFSSILDTIQFLGRKHCMVSIYESGSTDLTQSMLSIFDKMLSEGGISKRIFISMEKIDWEHSYRIGELGKIFLF